MNKKQLTPVLVLAVLILAIIACATPIPSTGSQVSMQDFQNTVNAAVTQTFIALEINNPLPTPRIDLIEATPGLTDTPQNPALPCDRAFFVEDLSVPENTVFAPNEIFTKSWRLRNDGSCTWNVSYSVAFENGNVMGAPLEFNLPAAVAPGQMMDLSMSMRAPGVEGNYRANFKLRNQYGATFGIQPDGNSPFWVQIQVKAPTATVTSTPSASPTVTQTRTRTVSPSVTLTKTITRTPTRTVSRTITRTLPSTATRTPTRTSTDVVASTFTPTTTQTVTHTPTATMTATHTVTPTVTDIPQALKQDLLASRCDATWENATTTLPCPGSLSDSAGFVVFLENPVMEDTTTYPADGIQTNPQWIENGIITGTYPAITIDEGDHFQAIIGCAELAFNCDVKMYLMYSQNGNDWFHLGPSTGWAQTYDGVLETVDIDLAPILNQTVQLRLMVAANGASNQDWATWIHPRVVD